MAVYSIETAGADEIFAALNGVKNAEMKIARAAVSAGLAVFRRAARAASPGTIKREIGRRLTVKNGIVSGRTGLTRFPRRGVKYSKTNRSPHGIYLERGTKYIAARHFVAMALAGARGPALAAMEAAVKRKIESLVGGK